VLVSSAGEVLCSGCAPVAYRRDAGRFRGPAVVAGEASNALFRGAVAQTGEAIALVVSTGRATMFGAAASALAEDAGPSPFQRTCGRSESSAASSRR